MNLGTFTKNEDGTFIGTATTLVNSFELEYRPIEKVGNGADFRVYRKGSDIEVGFARAEIGQISGKAYLNTLVDTPELAKGIWMALVREEDDSYVLKWSRPKRKTGNNGQNGQTAADF